MYIYRKTGKQIFTVGYYDPQGKLVTETVYPEKQDAVDRVHFLNGGADPELFSETTNHLYTLVANVNFLVEDLNQRLDRVFKPV
jgi:ribosomal protein S16